MILASGTKLGPYEIMQPAGAGGMGQVYKARDTRLNRFVAVKVLPERFSQNAEVKVRLDREAQTLASLNHPHICSVFDAGHHDGIDYLVMEFVEGQTLAQRLHRGALPLDEALKTATQIADALDKAHRQGVIHRDLKPANIMMTKNGAKLLDFGLAKLQHGGLGFQPLSSMPTAPAAELTGQGMIVGTLQYMPPEQLQGIEADARSDIFSFGAVLYEMLTGRKAFEGRSQSSLIAAIMHVDPPAISVLQPMTPPALDRLVKTCLAKDPNDRWQTAHDLCLQLQWIAEAAPQRPPAVSTRPNRRQQFFFAIAGILVMTVAVLTTREFRGRPSTGPEMRVEITTPVSTAPLDFALSPDGLRLVFVALDNGTGRLWIRNLDAAAAQVLPGTDDANYPFWSPDSRSIGFFAGGKLKRIDIDGGAQQTLADGGGGGAWNRDGVILFMDANQGALSRISSAGGKRETVMDLPGRPRFPQFLPDDRHFIFFALLPDQPAIYLASLDNHEVKRLVPADAAGAYAPPGLLLYIQQGTLRAQTVDIPRGVVTGSPVTVADMVGVGPYLNGGVSVSAAGTIAYRKGGNSRTVLTWFDRSGNTLGTVGDADDTFLGYPELSPDGRRVAVDRRVQGNPDIWLMDLLRGGMTRFTFETENDSRPLWTPDGTQILYRTGKDLYLKASGGTGAGQLLLKTANVKTPFGWSRDGRFLLYNETSDLFVLPIQGERKPVPIVKTPFFEGNGQFSPDGRWVVYQSDESTRSEIYVVPFPAGSGKWQISTAGGISPRWRQDGKELFFTAPDGHMMAATVSSSGNTFEAAPPVMLFQSRIINSGNAKQQYAVSADGRFLINVPAGDSASAPITLILNWKPKQ
jgi:eukaryotic-like serine/threonine-protein kinase